MKCRPFKIDDKRFRLPVDIIVECPKCNADVSLGGQFAYPAVGKPVEISRECKCGHEVITMVIIGVTVEPTVELPESCEPVARIEAT